MRRFLAAAAAAALAFPAAAAEPPMLVSYATDGALDCAGLSAEVAKTEAVIGGANDAVAGAQGSARAAELGASVGVNAALYSGALGRVPGLGAFGNMAANAAKQRAAAKQKSAENQIRVAETRRAMLMGMQAGKGCGAPTPVPQPQAASAPAAAPGGAVLPTLPAEATRHY